MKSPGRLFSVLESSELKHASAHALGLQIHE